MRIDKYLYAIRLTKSRSQAQALVDEAHIRVDGRRIVKASEAIRIGSVIALPLRGSVRVIRVLAMPARRGPVAEARLAYEELAEGQALTPDGSGNSACLPTEKYLP